MKLTIVIHPITCYTDPMMIRALTSADRLMGLPVDSACAKELSSVFGYAASHEGIDNPTQPKSWLCSVPSRTSAVLSRSQRPGTEERADNSDIAHTKYITTGRNVA
jgi:hypothetical protein